MQDQDDLQQRQIASMEVTIENAKRAIKLGEHFETLRKSPAFQALIEEEYFVQEAARLVSCVAAPEPSEGFHDSVKVDMIGISSLQQYFNKISRQADTMQQTLSDHQAAIAEMDAEGASE